MKYRAIFIWSSLVQYQNEKRLTSQLEALADEGFHGIAAPVGLLALFFISVLNKGGGSVKKSPCMYVHQIVQLIFAKSNCFRCMRRRKCFMADKDFSFSVTGEGNCTSFPFSLHCL